MLGMREYPRFCGVGEAFKPCAPTPPRSHPKATPDVADRCNKGEGACMYDTYCCCMVVGEITVVADKATKKQLGVVRCSEVSCKNAPKTRREGNRGQSSQGGARDEQFQDSTCDVHQCGFAPPPPPPPVQS